MVRTERQQVCWRATAGALIATQALYGVPLIARSSLSGDPNWTPPPPAPIVHVNRTVPKVASAPFEPRFSDAPTPAEIFRARVFDEPLVPAGGSPSVEESRALSSALLAFHRDLGRTWHSTIGEFLAMHPRSVWRASLLANLGSLESRAHRYASALDLWNEAWSLTKGSNDPAVKRIADYAIAEWLTLAASFGQVDKVRERLESLSGRALTGSAGVKIARARETISLIETNPNLRTLCGPQAILALIEATARPNPRGQAVLNRYRGELKGMSLVNVQSLAKSAGVALTMAERIGAANVPVPSIVHWRVGHYAAVVERDRNRYRIVDRARHVTYWIDGDTLFSESSGYFLIGGTDLPAGWKAVAPLTGAVVVGSGPLCPDGSAPPAPPPDETCAGCSKGMTRYFFQPVTASLLLFDTPLGYSPPRGPSVNFTVSYHQREILQPQVFAFANLGPKWTLNWFRYIKEEPTDGLGVTPAHVWVALPPGGREAYVNPDSLGVYPEHPNSRAMLARVSTNPIRYERRLRDGTVEVYGFSDGATQGTRRIFLTAIIDPQGQQLHFTWDSQLRLVAVSDALDQVSALSYDLASDPLKLTNVTDPFGRDATFTYNSAGELESITDSIGLISRFAYGDGDLVTKLSTPYGQTVFNSEPPALNSGYTTRSIEATDPLGGTEHLEFRYLDTNAC